LLRRILAAAASRLANSRGDSLTVTVGIGCVFAKIVIRIVAKSNTSAIRAAYAAERDDETTDNKTTGLCAFGPAADGQRRDYAPSSIFTKTESSASLDQLAKARGLPP
jgi:hypothetical protein